MTAVVVVTAVQTEAAAILAHLGAAGPAQPASGPFPASPAVGRRTDVRATQVGPYQGRQVASGAGDVLVLAGGIGPARAAACAATALALTRPELLVVAGVGGGFAGQAKVGDVVVADLVVQADLGADSPDGFRSIAELGLGADGGQPSPEQVAAAVGRVGGRAGPILTVCTCTGTAARAEELARRHHPAAEGMEGAGGWVAAEVAGVPFLEIRAISNMVGPRDRDSWELPRAVAALGQAIAQLLGEPLP
jgi:futalosine hydrolase